MRFHGVAREALVRSAIAVLGIWLTVFGILMLALPFLTVLPTGCCTAFLELISNQKEQSFATQAAAKVIGPIAPAEETLPSVENAVDIPTAVDAATPSSQVLASHQEPVTSMPMVDGMALRETATSQNVRVASELPLTAKVGTDIGDVAPDFVLRTMNGEGVTLTDLRGKKVMLNFWSTHCGACIVGFPLIRDTYVKHGSNSGDVAVITICIDARIDRIKAIENKYGDRYGPLDFPILLDEQTKTKNDYHIWAVPTTFFINSQGIIKQMKLGRFQSQQEIEDILKSLD